MPYCSSLIYVSYCFYFNSFTFWMEFIFFLWCSSKLSSLYAFKAFSRSFIEISHLSVRFDRERLLELVRFDAIYLEPLWYWLLSLSYESLKASLYLIKLNGVPLKCFGDGWSFFNTTELWLAFIGFIGVWWVYQTDCRPAIGFFRFQWYLSTLSILFFKESSVLSRLRFFLFSIKTYFVFTDIGWYWLRFN